MFTLDARKQGEESDYQSATYQGSGEDWISILYRIIHWYIPETKSPTIHCMHGLSLREWQWRSHRALPRIPRVLIIPLVRKHASPKYYDKMIVCRHWVTQSKHLTAQSVYYLRNSIPSFCVYLILMCQFAKISIIKHKLY